MMRVVLDANIFVSSVLVKQGLPAQIVAAWRERYYDLLMAPVLRDEIARVLAYPHIRRKYRIDDKDVNDLLDLLDQRALWVEREADVRGAIPDDPKDEHVLGCAIAGQADLIVSGDRHLLDLGSFQGIAIVSAREFSVRLQVG